MTLYLPPFKQCSIPWCTETSEVSTNVQFFHLPTDKIRRRAWIQALNISVSRRDFYFFTVCSRHFKSGRPSPHPGDVDWTPNQELKPNVVLQLKSKMRKLLDVNVNEIITNIPEVEEVFDVPEYVVLKKIGEAPTDHDYLGLPAVLTRPVETAPPRPHGHDYALNVAPACQDVNLPHFCNICVQEFGDSFKFNSHMLVHMHKNDVKCNLCYQSFFTTTCLNNHLRFKHTTVCPNCHKQIPLVQLFRHEMANAKQKNHILAKSVKRDERIWLCVFCGKKIGGVRQFHMHMESHNQVVL